MNVKGKTYQVRFDDDGYPTIINSDGEALSPPDTRKFAKELQYLIGDVSWIYIGYDEETGLHKVGATSNLERRRSELQAIIAGAIACRSQHVYRLETALHNRLLPFREIHEWYDFRNDGKILMSLLRIRNEDQLQRWLASEGGG